MDFNLTRSPFWDHMLSQWSLRAYSSWRQNANPRLSPAQGPRTPILAANAVENPAYRGKSDGPKPLKSPANAPHSPGMGVRGFPLTSA